MLQLLQTMPCPHVDMRACVCLYSYSYTYKYTGVLVGSKSPYFWLLLANKLQTFAFCVNYSIWLYIRIHSHIHINRSTYLHICILICDCQLDFLRCGSPCPLSQFAGSRCCCHLCATAVQSLNIIVDNIGGVTRSSHRGRLIS